MIIKKAKLRKDKISCKPNIIPILDAVFIFIFFLLMSARFVSFYVINSDAPSIKMVESVGNNQKTPLNLALEIFGDRIVVKTNPKGIIKDVVKANAEGYDWKKLLAIMIELKKSNIGENSVILRPQNEIPYKNIVKIIDVVRKVPPKDADIVGRNKDGELKKTDTLFDRVIFEGSL